MSAQVQTASGAYVTPLYPYRFTPDIADICHHLSHMPRFSGATRKFLSVAQHSCMVSDLCSNKNALWGLLHDAPEYLLHDIPRPLKQHPLFGEAYRDVEHALMVRICETFGLEPEEPREVKDADRRLAVTERRDLLPRDDEWFLRAGWSDYADVEPLVEVVVPWSPEFARVAYMRRFLALAPVRVAA